MKITNRVDFRFIDFQTSEFVTKLLHIQAINAIATVAETVDSNFNSIKAVGPPRSELWLSISSEVTLPKSDGMKLSTSVTQIKVNNTLGTILAFANVCELLLIGKMLKSIGIIKRLGRIQRLIPAKRYSGQQMDRDQHQMQRQLIVKAI
ncbi:hypothetical protein CCX46_21195 [Pseudomonas sp. RU47]|nr:hypothetical protein CCX46_21195 [Pseudomonas sp. RU47]